MLHSKKTFLLVVGISLFLFSVSINAQHNFPVPNSTYITGFQWLGDPIDSWNPSPRNQNIGGDTHPLTWGADDHIYVSAGDPWWGGKNDGLDFEKWSGSATNFTISKQNTMPNFTGFASYGCKPAGLISVGGTLYLAAQNLSCQNPQPNPGNGHTGSQAGYDAGIFYSTDYGVTWDVKANNPSSNIMFPGWKFGGPAFINYGKNNANAVDSYVYALSGDQWDNGDGLRCGRVPNNQITTASAWQWVSGFDGSGNPTWTNNLSNAINVLTDPDYIGLPDMVYIASIQRYLLLTWHYNVDAFTSNFRSGTQMIIYESPKPWGPFSLVYYEPGWGVGGQDSDPGMSPYCPRLPLKWFDQSTLTGYIEYTADINWSKGYRSFVRQFKLTVGNSNNTNLFTNEDVENPAGWTIYCTRDTSSGNPGYGFKLSSANNGAYQIISVSPNTSYTYTLDAKYAGSNGFCLWPYVKNHSDGSVLTSMYVTDTTWTKKTVPGFTTPSGCTSVEIGVWGWGGSGYGYADNFSLTSNSGATPTPTPAATPTPTPTPTPGGSSNIAINGTDTSSYKWNGSGWTSIGGANNSKIAVDSFGNVWVVNTSNQIWKYTTSWTQITGSASDIAAGGNGTVAINGTDGASYKWNGSGWTSVGGANNRNIAVDSYGNVWVVNTSNQIWEYTTSWAQKPGSASDIGAGGNGTVAINGTDGASYKWNGSGWTSVGGANNRNIAVDSGGNVWVVNISNQIWEYTTSWAQITGSASDIGGY